MLNTPANQSNPRPTSVKVAVGVLCFLGLVEVGASLYLAGIGTNSFSAGTALLGIVGLAINWVCAYGYWHGKKWSVILYGVYCGLGLLVRISQGSWGVALFPWLVFSTMTSQWLKGKLTGNFDSGQAIGAPKRSGWKVVGIVGGAIAGLSLVVGLVLLTLPLLTPKTGVTFKPAATLQQKAQPHDLVITAQILTDRAKQLGYQGISFWVDSGDQISGRVPTSMDSQELSRLTEIGLLELVDLGKTSLNGGEIIRTDFGSPTVQTGEGPVWHTVMSNSSFKSARVTTDTQGRFVVEFALTEQGSKTLAEFSKDNIGGYLAIALDKKILTVPQIRSAITGGTGQIAGNFTKEEAQNLVAILSTQPLPMALDQVSP